MEDAVVAALEGLRRGQRDFNVKCGLILCCYRSITPQQNVETVKLAHKYRDKGVIGIDLAGDETIFLPRRTPKRSRSRVNWKFRSRSMRAKAGSLRTFAKRCFDHGATRIGHGVSLQQDPELLKHVRDHGTVFEICLTSNLQTCSVPSLATHPFKKFLDEDVRVTLNTDDPVISNITLTDEFELAAREFKLGEPQIHELLVNAAQAAFVEPSVRLELVSRLRAPAGSQSFTRCAGF